jgi:hypothetical protein
MTFQIKYNFVFWDKYRTGALSSPPGHPFQHQVSMNFSRNITSRFLPPQNLCSFHLFGATWRRKKPNYTFQAQKWIQNGFKNLTKIVPRTSWYQELYENRHGIKINQNWTPFLLPLGSILVQMALKLNPNPIKNKCEDRYMNNYCLDFRSMIFRWFLHESNDCWFMDSKKKTFCKQKHKSHKSQAWDAPVSLDYGCISYYLQSMHKSMNERINEWLNEWMNWWMNQSMDEWMN